MEGRFAAPGVVDDLMGNDQVAGLQIGTDATVRSDRHDPCDATVTQGPDIGLVVDLVRRNRVAVTMTCEEGDFAASDLAESHGTGGLPVGRTQYLPMRDIEIR